MNTNALEALISGMPLAQLAQRSGRSVEEIVTWAMGGARGSAPAAPRSARATAPAAPKAAPASKGPRAPKAEGEADKEVNTRTAEGRERYDNSVLNVVAQSKRPIAASEIRERLGGTPLQVRAALNRLIENEQVDFQGRARAMRYTAR